ncbi:phosphonate ABC transporter, permease protein PhnE [Methylibium sp. Root1272]|uniref:phosphonate ABC transporter, permease protein PhnE n=1 Tax=Methylibium sp. Root1272 TaxID=1736441 RepID=UPI0006FA21D0|nr:phosphonate ABC transporter, permease protein PhnE [Methylibium sp. Root1272]KQW66771.1 phosphonate ABC transporter permease [Methylibium sp. Root1272]
MASTASSSSDLAAPPSRRRAAWIALGVGVLVVASFASLDLRWADFLSLEALGKMGSFAASFFPPQGSAAFLRKTLGATLETLAMSLVGTALAVLFGLALALPASASGPAGTRALRGLTRTLLNALRSVPELVWASLLLIAAGLGPFPGTLALALHTTGVLGRLFAESIENAAPEPAFALRLRGVDRLRVFLYATLPQIGPQLLSYSLYRWENNIRAAAVLGVVGAGGLGQMLYYHLGLFHMRESCTVLIAMIGLVALVDALSYLARRVLNR